MPGERDSDSGGAVRGACIWTLWGTHACAPHIYIQHDTHWHIRTVQKRGILRHALPCPMHVCVCVRVSVCVSSPQHPSPQPDPTWKTASVVAPVTGLVALMARPTCSVAAGPLLPCSSVSLLHWQSLHSSLGWQPHRLGAQSRIGVGSCLTRGRTCLATRRTSDASDWR